MFNSTLQIEYSMALDDTPRSNISPISPIYILIRDAINSLAYFGTYFRVADHSVITNTL